MMKNLLLAAFLFLFLGIKAQTNDDRKLLLQGFDETKVRQELTQQGLNADEHIDRMRRSYMAKRSKELGLVKVSASSHNDANHANTARNGNQHNTTLSSTCSNSSFQQLNFTGWSGNTGNADETVNDWTATSNTYTAGIVSYAPQPLNSPLIETAGGPGTILYNSSFTQIPTTNRHNIMNTPPTNNNPLSSSFSGYDSLAINPTTHLSDIPFVSPNGSGTSMRLGNANAGGETESITYSIAVTSATTLFTYQYAVVLNNPSGGGHTPINQPAFVISTKDQYGYPIDSTTSCGIYNVNTDAAATDTSYKHNSGDSYNAFADVYYKKWTSVSVDLTQYMGQTVTITFQTFDCAYSAHFGYAYLDAFCGSPTTAASVIGFCGTTNGNVTIVAPPGFVSYQWYGPNSSTTLATGTGINTQTLTTTAQINDTFLVKAVSPSGCNSQFKIVVKPSNIVLNLNSVSTCKGGSVGSVSAVAVGSGAYNYSWTGPLGALGTNTVVTNLPPGSYSVHVVDNTGQCPPKDTVVQVVSVNPTQQTATYQFCGTQPTLTAPAGSQYQWYDNSNTLMAVTTQTNVLTNPSNGQHYTVTYKDPTTNCEDSLKITLNKTTLVYDTATSHPCAGGSNGSIQYTNVSVNTYTTYFWSVTGAISSSGTTTATSPINLSGLGTGTYTMIISAPGNPTCSDTIKNNLIANNGIVIPNRDSSHAVCNMDTLQINANANPNISHSWTGPGVIYGANTTATFTIAPVFSGTVSPGFYTYTDSMHTAPGNCLSITKYIVKIKSFKNSTISVIEPLKCYHDSIAKIKVGVSTEQNGPISTPDKYTYTWSSSNPINSPNPTYATGVPSSSVLSNLKAGTYTCVIKNGNCINTVSYTLQDIPRLPNDSLFAYYCPKDSLALIIADTGNVNYVWHPSNTGATVTGDSIRVPVSAVNNYYVTYSHNGCPDTGKIIITVTTYDAFRPDELVNIFSPNGDTRNDYFYPFYSKTLNQYQIWKQSDTYELTVYDRWGILVYSATDYDKPWDGKTKSGHDADNGTYFFVVKYKSNCGSKADLVEKKGFVELMR